MAVNYRLMFLGVVAATIASAAVAQVDVYVGYADGLRGPGFFPNPWDGGAGVTFFGFSNGGSFDAGAIMFVNSGATNVTLDPGVNVNNFSDGASFQLWDSYIGAGVVMTPGSKVILTQTSDYNFDTSDYSIYGFPNSFAFPNVNYSLDGTAYTSIDSGQVLDTGGFDLASTGANESYRWRLIGTDGQPGAPAPAAAFVMLTGLIAKRRKRA